jgi:hypothetical protein
MSPATGKVSSNKKGRRLTSTCAFDLLLPLQLAASPMGYFAVCALLAIFFVSFGHFKESSRRHAEPRAKAWGDIRSSE